MRRKEKEITDNPVIEDIIQKAEVCRIGMCDGDVPYVVPMNFGYKDNCIYVHSAQEGRKIDILRKNNKVCFEIDYGNEIKKTEKACNWSSRYRSIIGFGRAFIVEGFQEKKKGLDIIMEHYTGKPEHEYPDNAVNSVAVIRIDIESMTGKKSD